jgi:hypothetical protein
MNRCRLWRYPAYQTPQAVALDKPRSELAFAMANTAQAFGFQHIGYLPGYAPDMAPSRRSIQSTYATSIFFGDPVVKSSASPYIQAVTASATVTSDFAGIFQGCVYIPTGQAMPVYAPFYPGGTKAADATALIIDSPGALFRVASGTTATSINPSAVGNNINWSTGAGGTTTGGGFSTFTVDQATLATTATLPFTIVDMWSNRAIGNGSDNSSAFNWVVVTPNSQQFRAGQTGVA